MRGENAAGTSQQTLGVRECVHEFAGFLFHVVAALAKGLGNGQQDFAEARTAHGVLGREVGSAVKRLALGRQERRQRPAALSADGRHRRLVTRIDVGTLVAVDLNGHEVRVDDLGHLGRLVGLAIHDVTPVAPYRPYVEQDGLVFALRFGKSFVAPLPPAYGLMHGGAEVGRRRLRQQVLARAHGS